MGSFGTAPVRAILKDHGEGCVISWLIRFPDSSTILCPPFQSRPSSNRSKGIRSEVLGSLANYVARPRCDLASRSAASFYSSGRFAGNKIPKWEVAANSPVLQTTVGCLGGGWVTWILTESPHMQETSIYTPPREIHCFRPILLTVPNTFSHMYNIIYMSYVYI